MVKIKGSGRRPDAGAGPGGEVRIDLHRAYIFPNRMRDQRRSHGYPKLLRLAAALPEIPYIRLSKIERGEVVARPDEVRRIAGALGIAPAELLLDIDGRGFDIAVWARPFEDGTRPISKKNASPSCSAPRSAPGAAATRRSPSPRWSANSAFPPSICRVSRTRRSRSPAGMRRLRRRCMRCSACPARPRCANW
jgi:hypothetical protein